MAVPVFVSVKIIFTNCILRAAAHELGREDRAIHVKFKVQTRNTCSSGMAAAGEVSRSLPEVGEVPHQPERYVFPRRQFGKSKVVSRAFQGSWFHKWQWLHYESTTDLAFCHTCVTAIK